MTFMLLMTMLLLTVAAIPISLPLACLFAGCSICFALLVVHDETSR